MIRALRRRFLLIAMASLAGTLTLLCLAINLGYRHMVTQRADAAVEMLHQTGGAFQIPDAPVDPAAHGGFQVTPETPFETRYFIVHLTENREVTEVDAEHIAALDRRMVVEWVGNILDGGKHSGYTSYYRYGVFAEPDGGTTIVVLDCFLQLQGAGGVLRISLLAAGVCLLTVFLLLLLLSRRVTRPFVENLERQRQFVTDASHELKTPLAIISANTGLLSASLGENQWLESTRAQVGRLDRLIQNLIELARTEEALPDEAAAPVPLGRVAERALEDFRPLAEAAGKTLDGRIEPELVLPGVEDNLARLCALLLDNAVKYCDEGGAIRLTLARRGRWAVLSVSNPCAGLDAAQLPRLFDRFYRADSSRARSSGGYGIGLSTARAIVARHHGRLTARLSGGTVTFTAVLPLFSRPPERFLHR